MPCVSKTTASEVNDFGPAVDHCEHLDGYTVNFVSIRETHSLAMMLKGLPDDACQCPHWGQVVAGEMTVTYTDGREETYAAGDAFYMPPGHAPSAIAGTDFVMFSPKDQLAITDAAIAANVQKMMDAPR
jgi:hypothetical protein